MTLPPLGTLSPGDSAPLEAADRLVLAIVDGDARAAERELALDVCAWWRDGSSLASLHGPRAVADALVALFRERGAERLRTRATSEGSVLISALVADRVGWSLELRSVEGRFTGAVVRGVPAPKAA